MKAWSATRTWTAIATAIVAGGALLGPPVAQAEVVLADRLAVVSDRGGGTDIYLLDPADPEDGWTRLTTDRRPKGHPALSPSGDRVAFVQDGDIRIVSIAGGIPLEVVGSPEHREAQPAWSPDGRKLVFERHYPGRGRSEVDLVIRTLGTEEETRIMLPGNERSPDWSAAVTTGEIAFASNRTGTMHIWRVDATPDVTGSHSAEQVTTSKDPSYDPAWSPDGKKLSFSRWYRGIGLALTVLDLDPEIRNERRLGNGGQDWGGDWSPDGQWIAYRHEEGHGVNAQQLLYLVSTVGDPAPERLTTHGNTGTPSWGRVPLSVPASKPPAAGTQQCRLLALGEGCA